jgi:hypothetical protein
VVTYVGVVERAKWHNDEDMESGVYCTIRTSDQTKIIAFLGRRLKFLKPPSDTALKINRFALNESQRARHRQELIALLPTIAPAPQWQGIDPRSDVSWLQGRTVAGVYDGFYKDNTLSLYSGTVEKVKWGTDEDAEPYLVIVVRTDDGRLIYLDLLNDHLPILFRR